MRNKAAYTCLYVVCLFVLVIIIYLFTTKMLFKTILPRYYELKNERIRLN